MQELQEGIMHTRNIAEMQDCQYTRGMSEALGAYLKTLREGYGLRPSEVLAQLGERLGKAIDESRLWRTEKGKSKTWPEGDYLTALYDIVKADLDDVAWIQKNAGAKAADGERLANKRLQRRAEEIAETAKSEEKVTDILDFVRRLRADPEASRELRRLIAEGDAQQH
jgi:transcriptional regulator with XRE-family HTH domain